MWVPAASCQQEPFTSGDGVRPQRSQDALAGPALRLWPFAPQALLLCREPREPAQGFTALLRWAAHWQPAPFCSTQLAVVLVHSLPGWHQILHRLPCAWEVTAPPFSLGRCHMASVTASSRRATPHALGAPARWAGRERWAFRSRFLSAGSHLAVMEPRCEKSVISGREEGNVGQSDFPPHSLFPTLRST